MARPGKTDPMPTPTRPDEPWYARAWRRTKEIWRTEDSRVAVLRDIAVAAGVVGILLIAVWAYTGQPFPSQAPLVVVESGSMMHGPYRGGNLGDPTGWGDPAFGRIRTIDPGDLVLVKDVDEVTDVETAFGSGSRGGYGGHGDVIVFKPFGDSDGTPIIHRAMLLVMGEPEGCTPQVDCTYRVPEACAPEFAQYVQSIQGNTIEDLCNGTPRPVTMLLERDGLVLKLTNYPCDECGPFYSSFITRGDNNNHDDQRAQEGGRCDAACNSPPVRMEWVIGKARGEVPWFGMIKLMIYGNDRYEPATDPTKGENWKVINATAPWDIWLSLFIAVAVLVATPVAIDLIRHELARRAENGKGGRERPPPRDDDRDRSH